MTFYDVTFTDGSFERIAYGAMVAPGDALTGVALQRDVREVARKQTGKEPVKIVRTLRSTTLWEKQSG